MLPRAALVLAAFLALPTATVLAADCDPWVDLWDPGFLPVAATIGSAFPHGLVNICADGPCPDDNHAPLEIGDRIIITSPFSDSVACAVRIGPAPDYRIESGYVPLNILEPDNEPAKSWVGEWQAGAEQFISIFKNKVGGRLDVVGTATWGLADPERAASGAINSGGFHASLDHQGGRLDFTMDDGTLPYDPASDQCSVRLWLAGEFLVAADNNACGGLNVTFSGFYSRLPPY